MKFLYSNLHRLIFDRDKMALVIFQVGKQPSSRFTGGYPHAYTVDTLRKKMLPVLREFLPVLWRSGDGRGEFYTDQFLGSRLKLTLSYNFRDEVVFDAECEDIPTLMRPSFTAYGRWASEILMTTEADVDRTATLGRGKGHLYVVKYAHKSSVEGLDFRAETTVVAEDWKRLNHEVLLRAGNQYRQGWMLSKLKKQNADVEDMDQIIARYSITALEKEKLFERLTECSDECDSLAFIHSTSIENFLRRIREK